MFKIHPTAQIHPTARINVDHGSIGAGAKISEGAIIEGRHVRIGREAFLGRGAWIGNGGCRDPEASLEAGDFLHLGWNVMVNTARAVTLGDEVCLGTESKLYTHGAALSAWEGFPVQFAPVVIGDRVWLPNAWINPGVTIGSDVLVVQRAVVTRDLPSGCIAVGNPAVPKVKEAYPRALDAAEKRSVWERIYASAQAIAGTERRWEPVTEGSYRIDGGTIFDLDRRRIEGQSDDFTETLRNQLRRNGIRFRYESIDGAYRPWAAGDD